MAIHFKWEVGKRVGQTLLLPQSPASCRPGEEPRSRLRGWQAC